jgi:formate dehydrogenase iron-sulfur subunit
MNFGDREEMSALAKKRLSEVESKFPNATATGLEDLRCFYLLADKPHKYYEHAGVKPIQRGMDRKLALKKIGRSLKELSKERQVLNKLVG